MIQFASLNRSQTCVNLQVLITQFIDANKALFEFALSLNDNFFIQHIQFDCSELQWTVVFALIVLL